MFIYILILISLRFIDWVPIDNKSVLVLVNTRCKTSNVKILLLFVKIRLGWGEKYERPVVLQYNMGILVS